MKSKEKEQIQARHLRHKGFSLNQIVAVLNISKSSASTWVRDVKMTKAQHVFLHHKAHVQEVIKKRVETRLRNENARRRAIMEIHKKDIPTKPMDTETLKIFGTALYWAEGGKSQKNRSFNFWNSDPRMIRIMMIFLKNVCKIPDEKFRAHINLHAHLNSLAAEKYWSLISGIPLSQFYKTTKIISKASKNTRDTLPYGTFSIQIGSTDLFLKMLAWIEAITERVVAQQN
ncbi:MAG: hypothetical protein HYT64_01535 [Candidatus Yanofskybacteria bacterium]|nr:hypothetical protein [Candidatus Yanofskybacteria bacterium]